MKINCNANHYILDKDTHKYYLNYPSVTKIVDMIFPFKKDDIDPKFLDMAIEKGNCVHENLDKYVKNGFKRLTEICNHDIKSHVEHYSKNEDWLFNYWQDNQYKLKPNEGYKFESEKTIISHNLKLIGQVDLVISKKFFYHKDEFEVTEKTIIDWKTSKIIKDSDQIEKWKLQLILYSLIEIESSNIDIDNFNLILVDNGKEYINFGKQNNNFFEMDKWLKYLKIIEKAINDWHILNCEEVW